MLEQTRWPQIYWLFLTGVTAALLLGKVPVALPLLRDDLQLSHFEAGLLVSIFALTSGAVGAVLGAVADRNGQIRMALMGMVIAAGASLLGAVSPTYYLLLVTRVIEGAGFLLLSVSLPPLMLRLAQKKDHPSVMGLWGAFLPAGAGAIMLVGGALSTMVGWRGIWLITGVLLLCACAWFISAIKSSGLEPRVKTTDGVFKSYAILRRRGPALLTGIFACYSAQFLAVSAFVPLILVEQAGWSVMAAGGAGAAVIAANIVGSLLAGRLLKDGTGRSVLVVTAVFVMAICAALVLTDTIPAAARLAAAIAFSAFGGLIPGAIFAGASVHAPDPAKISTVNGLLLQGMAVGQLVGPVTAAALVGLNGVWANILWLTTPLALITALFAIALGRLENGESNTAVVPATD